MSKRRKSQYDSLTQINESFERDYEKYNKSKAETKNLIKKLKSETIKKM
jgi:hypothetical protein